MQNKLLLLLLSLALVGCKPSTPNKSAVFRIGYQKGTALQLLRLQGDLDRRLEREGVKVEWVQFTAAPPMLEAIGVGSLDLGSGGDAPVVFAQAAGYPIALLANTPPAAEDSRGVIVPASSPLKSITELRGKRVAISKGTASHSFLIQLLEKAGVPYSAITPVYLSPSDARAAFDAGKVDAWATWDPFLIAARRAAGARLIANGKGVVTAGTFYFSTRAFARAQPTWIKAALEEVDKKAVWLWQHPKEAAEVFAPELGVDVATLEVMNQNAVRGDKYVGFRPIDEALVKAQQTIADNFLTIKLLPKPVDVHEALLTPEEYAAFLPTTEKVAQK